MENITECLQKTYILRCTPVKKNVTLHLPAIVEAVCIHLLRLGDDPTTCVINPPSAISGCVSSYCDTVATHGRVTQVNNGGTEIVMNISQSEFLICSDWVQQPTLTMYVFPAIQNYHQNLGCFNKFASLVPLVSLATATWTKLFFQCHPRGNCVVCIDSFFHSVKQHGTVLRSHRYKERV